MSHAPARGSLCRAAERPFTPCTHVFTLHTRVFTHHTPVFTHHSCASHTSHPCFSTHGTRVFTRRTCAFNTSHTCFSHTVPVSSTHCTCAFHTSHACSASPLVPEGVHTLPALVPEPEPSGSAAGTARRCNLGIFRLSTVLRSLYWRTCVTLIKILRMHDNVLNFSFITADTWLLSDKRNPRNYLKNLNSGALRLSMCLKNPCAVPIGDASQRPHNLIKIQLLHFSPFLRFSKLYRSWPGPDLTCGLHCAGKQLKHDISTRVLRSEVVILLKNSS